MRAEDVLPDDVNQAEVAGFSVRKGTVAAFLNNARIWCDPASREADRAEAERDMTKALPALRALGLFEVLALRDARLASFLAQT
jgi:hypothetical protein